MHRRSYVKTTAGSIAGGTIAGLAGCLRDGGSDWNQTVGVVTPQTGSLGFAGQGVVRGAKVAANQMDGLSIQTGDTAGDVQSARSVVQGMLEDNVPGMGGTISSDVALAVRDQLEEEEAPHVNTLSGDPEITQDGTAYTSRIYGDQTQLQRGVAQFLSNDNVSNVALIGADYSAPRAGLEGLKTAIDENGYDIEVVQESFLPLGTSNFRPEISKIDDDEVDAVLFYWGGAQAVALVQQLREAGLHKNNIILGNPTLGAGPLVNALGEDIDGISYFGIDESTSRAQEVITQIEDQHDVSNLGYTYELFGYDVVTIIGRAMNEVDTLNPETLNEAVRSTEFESACGFQVKFGENGHNTKVRVTVNTWQSRDSGLEKERRFKSDPISP